MYVSYVIRLFGRKFFDCQVYTMRSLTLVIAEVVTMCAATTLNMSASKDPGLTYSAPACSPQSIGNHLISREIEKH